MAISDLSGDADLYLAWQNVLSSADNFVSALQSCKSKMIDIQNMANYGANASASETSYMTELETMIDDFISGLPVQPS